MNSVKSGAVVNTMEVLGELYEAWDGAPYDERPRLIGTYPLRFNGAITKLPARSGWVEQMGEAVYHLCGEDNSRLLVPAWFIDNVVNILVKKCGELLVVENGGLEVPYPKSFREGDYSLRGCGPCLEISKPDPDAEELERKIAELYDSFGGL